MNLKAGINNYQLVVNRHRINIRCKYSPGSSEVILFIHGLACSLESFRNVMDYDYFPDKSLLLVDLVGFGKSSKPEEFSYTMEAHAKLLEQLFSLLPRWDIHVAAHSMGGAISLLFQPNVLSRVQSFANIEGNLISDDCGALSRGIISVSYEEYRNNMFNKHLIEFEGHQQLRFEETSPIAVFKSAKSLVEWSDSGELLNKFRILDCKKSYFYGEENKEMPVLEKLNFVQKYMIRNSGHGMMTENPEEFYTKLADFIDSK